MVLKKDAVLAGMGFLFGTQGVNYSVNVAINTTVAIAGVTPPAVGAAPVTAITETAQYTGTVTWSGAPTTFGYSTVYTATITLTPKTNYTFAGVAENFFTVAGATATNDANSGVITAVFPRTDGVPYIPPTPTIPGSGGVNIEYTKSGDAVTLQLPMSKVNALIESAEDGVVSLDLSGLKGTSIVNIPTDALSKIADAGLGLDVKLPGGNLAIDADALASFVDSAGGAQISLTLRQIEPSELSAAQGATLKSGDTVFEISVSSGGAEIHEFNGVFTATVNYNGKSPAAAWYLDGEGKREKLGGKYNVEDKTFTFTLPHLSLYVVGYDEVAAWENPFSDVSMDDWFYEDVYFAATHDPVLFNGTSATTFSPNTAMSRAMLVTVLWRLAGSPPVKTSEVIEFSDVPYGAYYEIAVDWARVNGIVSGIGGLFYPDANITRQDAATILCRFAEHLGLDVSASADLSAFADAGDVSGYAETAMEWAVSVGMIRGRSATQLAPKGSLTRAEIAAILHRFVENVVDAE
ncbi:MAG: S-layer homology domain-containing protein [Oscillospiraceae bacterium]|nr:S-layer homology domain-containing protein [Oscillospiraceae bacterium]